MKSVRLPAHGSLFTLCVLPPATQVVQWVAGHAQIAASSRAAPSGEASGDGEGESVDAESRGFWVDELASDEPASWDPSTCEDASGGTVPSDSERDSESPDPSLPKVLAALASTEWTDALLLELHATKSVDVADTANIQRQVHDAATRQRHASISRLPGARRRDPHRLGGRSRPFHELGRKWEESCRKISERRGLRSVRGYWRGVGKMSLFFGDPVSSERRAEESRTSVRGTCRVRRAELRGRKVRSNLRGGPSDMGTVESFLRGIEFVHDQQRLTRRAGWGTRRGAPLEMSLRGPARSLR
jgi:hypothetical protein